MRSQHGSIDRRRYYRNPCTASSGEARRHRDDGRNRCDPIGAVRTPIAAKDAQLLRHRLVHAGDGARHPGSSRCGVAVSEPSPFPKGIGAVWREGRKLNDRPRTTSPEWDQVMREVELDAELREVNAEAQADQTPGNCVDSICAADVTQTPVQWLWPNRL